MRRVPHNFPRGGFTLIELLVVLALAALLLGVAPPMISRALPGVQLKKAAGQIAAGMRFARDRALSLRRETVVSVDVEGRVVSITGRARTLAIPTDLQIDLVTARSEIDSGNVGRFRFFPDGTSTGGRVTLTYRDSGYDVDIDWLTGRVDVAANRGGGT